LNELCHGIEARLNGLTLDQRPQNPGAQQARAHAGHGNVQRGNESRGATRTPDFFRENGSKQLQVAHRNGIEHQGIVLLVVADAVEMPQGFNAGSINGFICGHRTVAARGVFAQIVNDGPGGSQRLLVIVQAKAREFSDAELLAQDAFGIVPLEDPIFEARFDSADALQQ